MFFFFDYEDDRYDASTLFDFFSLFFSIHFVSKSPIPQKKVNQKVRVIWKLLVCLFVGREGGVVWNAWTGKSPRHWFDDRTALNFSFYFLFLFFPFFFSTHVWFGFVFFFAFPWLFFRFVLLFIVAVISPEKPSKTQ